MQIGEDDSDQYLEAITEREWKPSRVPLCPARPRKPYHFWRLHSLPTGELMVVVLID